MSIERVGIIGAGQMGGGIAHVCALAGYDVILEDVNAEALGRAKGLIEKNMHRQAARGLIKDDLVEPALKRISTTQNLDDLKDRDLVIEAATEDESVKRKIFQDLCPRLTEKTLIATNTSSISVTRLAASTDRPEHFIGLHFMNPVPMMQLVEVIRGIATDDGTFQAALEIVKRVGKTAAYAEDFPAFIVNRILLPMINEAVYTLYEGVGQRRCDRHRHAARRQSSDGAAAAGGFHRPRYLPVGDAGALRGVGGFQIPPLPAAREICRSGLARPQDRPRLLRLSRRTSGADALKANSPTRPLTAGRNYL